jgi:tripartite-type tricarboxylate transporter receptor subunit TctC
MQDLLGGQVDATFMNINTGLPNIKAGKLRALAITSSNVRRSCRTCPRWPNWATKA